MSREITVIVPPIYEAEIYGVSRIEVSAAGTYKAFGLGDWPTVPLYRMPHYATKGLGLSALPFGDIVSHMRTYAAGK